MKATQYTIYDCTYEFALNVVNICKTVKPNVVNKNMISQLVRSATSISANLQEANVGISRKDFINKITIALKESRETVYWLQLLSDSKYIDIQFSNTLIQECTEITKILGSIKVKTKTNPI